MPSVLVVDDDYKLLKAVQTRLESVGYEVAIAQDGYQALALSVQTHPDLLVLDINLPAGNGFGVEQRLHKIDGYKDIPVIYITGESPDVIDRKNEFSTAKMVLYKPFTSSELVQAVQDALDPLAF